MNVGSELLSVTRTAGLGDLFFDFDLFGTAPVVCFVPLVNSKPLFEVELPGCFVWFIIHAVAESIRCNFRHAMLSSEFFGASKEPAPNPPFLIIRPDTHPSMFNLPSAKKRVMKPTIFPSDTATMPY